MGGIYGCSCKEVYIYIDLLLLLLLYLLFYSIPTFCSLNFFCFVLVTVLFCNLCNNFFAQYKHTYRHPTKAI